MQSQSFWEVLLTIILAFIGGGIVNLFFEFIRTKKKNTTLKKLLLAEIKTNKKILGDKYLEEYPWMTHKIFNAFYTNQMNLLTDLDYDEDKLEKIVEYYNLLDLLKDRDKESEYIDSLRKEGKFDGADAYQKTLGNTKKEIRKNLTDLSNEILE
jgi:hypothetical protein